MMPMPMWTPYGFVGAPAASYGAYPGGVVPISPQAFHAVPPGSPPAQGPPPAA
jgi:hypothetical protein